MNETQDMPITSISILTIVFKNLLWLLALAFYPLMEYIIQVIPDWKNYLENFKLIGGAIIMLMVIMKLLLEIIKLLKNKQ